MIPHSAAMSEATMVKAVGANLGVRHASTMQELIALTEMEGQAAVLPFNLRQPFLCLNEVHLTSELVLNVGAKRAVTPKIVNSASSRIAIIAEAAGSGLLRLQDRVCAVAEVNPLNWKETHARWANRMTVPEIHVCRLNDRTFIFAPLRAWAPR